MSMIRRTAAVGVALALAMPASAAVATPEPPEVGARVGTDFTWAGSWDSNWGLMTLTGDASGMEGTYTHDAGRISADVVPGAGAVYRGVWSEAPTYTGPRDAGALEFTVSADGRSFTGNWSYADAVGWSGGWEATCVGGPCLDNSTDPLTPVVVPETGKVLGPATVRRPKAATFRFSSPTAGVTTYQYKLDGKPWKSTTRTSVRVRTKTLKVGKHALKVRAVLGTEVDRTPSVRRFKVR